MTRLHNFRSALLAAYPEVADKEIDIALDTGGPDFVTFVIDHGLGPLWHTRTLRDEFRASRLSAEALYLAQENALREIDEVLDAAAIEYVVIKGAANRLLLNENPAIRPCFDIDLLVRSADRVRAASALVDRGFIASPVARIISHQLVLARGLVDIDLHWRLLREGRLGSDCEADMLSRRRRSNEVWMLNAEDALFALLVHPAFAKHLDGWGMGLHRVVDILHWVRSQSFDWQAVRAVLEANGVRTAAWATLRWVQLLTYPCAPDELDTMVESLQPNRSRQAWLNYWLRNDLSSRTSGAHWLRLLGFSLFLHDTPRDAVRAFAGRRRAQRRSSTDLEAFSELPR